MGLRDRRQEQFAKVWLKSRFGILYLCPRFGKIKTTIHCLKELGDPEVLIIYPIETIKTSWEEDLKKWSYDSSKVSYCTTASLWKLAENPRKYDVIVMDEIHLFSPANLMEMKALIDFGNSQVLGLSGTISKDTEAELLDCTKLKVLARYPIEQAIKEKVITDYEIHVALIDLDDKVKHVQPYKKSPKYVVTEKFRYGQLTDKIIELRKTGDDLGMLPLQRMHVLNKSIAKLSLTKKLLNKYKDERILVFCGITSMADKLGIPVYHSKAKDEQLKNDFCAGKGNHLATVDMFEAGVTVKPINKAIINAFDSNPENLSQRISRLTGYEYDNPDKKAVVYIICTNTIERKWLTKALEFFDQSKVKYYS